MRTESLRAETPAAESLRGESLNAEVPKTGASQPGATEPVPTPPPSLTDPAEKLRQTEALEKYLESVTTYNGPVLKKIRELHGLTLENIAEHTKIRRTYLEYMEEGEFAFLPAEIYVKGFIGLVARVLDLPPERVSADYMDTYYKKNSS